MRSSGFGTNSLKAGIDSSPSALAPKQLRFRRLAGTVQLKRIKPCFRTLVQGKPVTPSACWQIQYESCSPAGSPDTFILFNGVVPIGFLSDGDSHLWISACPSANE